MIDGILHNKNDIEKYKDNFQKIMSNNMTDEKFEKALKLQNYEVEKKKSICFCQKKT